MDDLPHLISILKACPPPLTKEEQESLNKVIDSLSDTGSLDKSGLSPNPPEFQSIQMPQPIAQKVIDPQSRTVYETQNTLVVGQGQQFTNLAAALGQARDNATIHITDGVYTENVTLNSSIHLVAAGPNVQFYNSKFDIKASSITFRGIRFASDNEIFTVSRTQISFQGCVVECKSTQPAIDVQSSAVIEIDQCNIICPKIADIKFPSNIRAYNSSIEGSLLLTKCDFQAIACQFDGHAGSSIEALNTTVNVSCSLFKGSRVVALNLREHSFVKLADTEFRDINGAGILIHGSSKLETNKVIFSNIDKAAIMVTNESTAKISGSAIIRTQHTGLEIINNSSVECNETWISETRGSCVLIDNKSKINTIRCRITKSARHGIEIANGSNATVEDTQIDCCDFSAILATNSKVQTKSCLFTDCKDSIIFADDHAWLELTRTTVSKGLSDGCSAESECMINTNACYFVDNETFGLNIKGCRDCKIQSSVISGDKGGGLNFVNNIQLIIDGCFIDRNSMIISACPNAVVRQSILSKMTNKHPDKPREFIDIIDKSKATFEENKFIFSQIRIKKAEAAIRQNKFANSQNFAIQGENSCNLLIESNEISRCKMAFSLKDNSSAHFFNNKISNIIRPQLKEGMTARQLSLVDTKAKAISVKTFSKALIEGNVISGDYDYAIYVDGQSTVENRANQIQCGNMGGIAFSGVSNGLCEDNSFTGKDPQHAVFFAHGCNSIRR